MTKFEFVTKALEIANAQGNEEMVEFAQAWLDKDAADKEKAKVKRAEKAKEGSELDNEFGKLIVSICGTEPVTRGTIFDELIAAGHSIFGEKELTPARVSRICGMLVEQGKLDKVDVKTTIVGKDGKTKAVKQVGYAIA